jgi:hypothetical protein
VQLAAVTIEYLMPAVATLALLVMPASIEIGRPMRP